MCAMQRHSGRLLIARQLSSLYLNLTIDLKEKSRPSLDEGAHGWDFQGRFPIAPHHNITNQWALERPGGRFSILPVAYDGRTECLKRLGNHG